MKKLLSQGPGRLIIYYISIRFLVNGLVHPYKGRLDTSCKYDHFHGHPSIFLYMGVSKNRGTPKSSILIGFSIINHPFCGYPYFWQHPHTSYSHLSIVPFRSRRGTTENRFDHPRATLGRGLDICGPGSRSEKNME